MNYADMNITLEEIRTNNLIDVPDGAVRCPSVDPSTGYLCGRLLCKVRGESDFVLKCPKCKSVYRIISRGKKD